MLKQTFIFQLALLVLMVSCSHTKPTSGISIATASAGLMKNQIANFPVYLTESLVSRSDLEKKYSSEIYLIHIGHLLNPKASKEENEKTLSSLKDYGINLVNLTLLDFAIAEAQGINFENYGQAFLNSTVYDLSMDSLASGKNITSYMVHNGVAFIGLSDSIMDINLPQEKYIITDYVLSILKIKKAALKTATPTTINSFVLIHNLGLRINEVMERLPPSFINSLAD